MVLGRARCTAASVGQRVRKSQATCVQRSGGRGRGLGKIGFECSGEAIGEARAIIDETTALLDQELQRARLSIIGCPGGEAVTMLEQEFGQVGRIGGIILSAARQRRLRGSGRGWWDGWGKG